MESTKHNEDKTLTNLKEEFSPAIKLKAITLGELLKTYFKPRELILAPWLSTQSLCMIYAPRGVGKTYVALNIAYAIANGTNFLSWHAVKSWKVCYIDGEMPGCAIQKRMRDIATKNTPSENLIILTPDLQEYGMPDLGTIEGQDAIEPIIKDVDLIIIDNLSCLVRTGRENEAESWLLIQEWSLKMRARGKSVLFIHHAGKGGKQRGTSRREDVLDTVINLKRPNDYTPDKGALFEVHFEKSRYLYGKEVEPFEAQLTTDKQGLQCWTTRTLEISTYEKVIELHQDGLSPSEIIEALHVNKSTVYRHLKEARKLGKID
jgi:hypothetical protein